MENKWISVKDRLPEFDNEDTSLNKMVSDTLFLRGISIDGGRGFGIGDYCEGDVWRDYGGDYDFMHIKEVTHWMLPPKE